MLPFQSQMKGVLRSLPFGEVKLELVFLKFVCPVVECSGQHVI